MLAIIGPLAAATSVLGKAFLDNNASRRDSEAKEFVAMAGIGVAALGLLGVGITAYSKTRQLPAR
jgi:hypothetical protein